MHHRCPASRTFKFSLPGGGAGGAHLWHNGGCGDGGTFEKKIEAPSPNA